MSRHASKVALVPSAFFDPASAREVLSQTVRLDPEDKVEYISLPEFSAELVYSLSPSPVPEPVEGPELYPELYYVLKALSGIRDYNKIVASYSDGLLHLAIAQGGNLLLANVFEAADFTTAEYFLFLSLRKFQMNPEVSTVCFRTPLSDEERMSLYRYFKSVDNI